MGTIITKIYIIILCLPFLLFLMLLLLLVDMVTVGTSSNGSFEVVVVILSISLILYLQLGHIGLWEYHSFKHLLWKILIQQGVNLYSWNGSILSVHIEHSKSIYLFK